MDTLRLERWKASFEKQAEILRVEYDAFFLTKKFQDTYRLRIDDTNQTLSYGWIRITSRKKFKRDYRSYF